MSLKEKLINRSDCEIKLDYPLAQETTFQIGGRAEMCVIPHSRDALVEILRLTYQFNTPTSILGKGSNVLISDRGIPGLTVLMPPRLNQIEIAGETLVCDAGAEMKQIAQLTLERSLTGFEGLSGIPGTIGGAAVMNAGAYGTSFSDCVLWVEYCDEQGEIHQRGADELELGYRHSFFSQHPGVILRVALGFEKSTKEAVRAKTQEYQQKRAASQPLEMASAGSTFKRPEGYYTGQLISDLGLKGYRRGACGVSSKHAGFVVNYGGATAREMKDFIEEIREKVKTAKGVVLMPEVLLKGDWKGEIWNSLS